MSNSKLNSKDVHVYFVQVIGPSSACCEPHASASCSAPVTVGVQHGEQHKGYGAARVDVSIGREDLVVTLSAVSMRLQKARPSSVLLCVDALYRSRMESLPAQRSKVQRAWGASEQMPSRECIAGPVISIVFSFGYGICNS